jgi:hypothetical protein
VLVNGNESNEYGDGLVDDTPGIGEFAGGQIAGRRSDLLVKFLTLFLFA